ncbi:MAG: hypothetical protein ABIP63_06410 [Thermoanaerobaculia bacterium]
MLKERRAALPSDRLSDHPAEATHGGVRAFLGERQLWILVVGVFAFFLQPLTTRTFFFRDNSLLNIPTHFLLAKSLRAGSIPLWNPFLHGGQPLLGSPTSTILYPANLLHLLLPPLQAFNTIVVLHFVLCAAFAYLLARSLGISGNASMIAGILYALSGFSLSQANLYQKLLALPWIPFCLLAAHQSIRLRPRFWTSWFLIGLLTQILANSPETTVATGLLTILFVATVADPAFRKIAILRVVAAMVLAAGLAAVQLLPAAEMTAMSTRGAQRSYERFTTWSLHPARLPELIVPGYFGRTNALSEEAYWGRRREDTGFPNVLSIYFGFPALLLAFLGATGSSLRPNLRRLLLACAILGVVLACGRFLPGFHSMYRLAPAVALFRYPVKAIVFSLVPISLLAAAGADSFAKRNLIVGLPGAVAATAIALIALPRTASDATVQAIDHAAFGATLSSANHEHLLASLVHLLVSALALLLVAAWSWQRRSLQQGDAAMTNLRTSRRAAWLAAIVACDLVVAGVKINPYAHRALFSEPSLAQSVRSVAAGAQFYRAPDPTPFHLTAPSDDVIWLTRFNLRTLRYYTAQAWLLPTIFHFDFDGLANRDIVRLGDLANRLPWRRRLPILSAAGVRAILAPGRLLLPQLRPVREFPSPTGSTWILHENRDALRVRFVTHARSATEREQQLSIMSSDSFQPAQEVLLDPGVPSDGSAPAAAAKVEILKQEPDRSLVRVHAAGAGWLVYAEPFAPGWSARLDSQPADLLRANYAFSAVAIPTGMHVVERTYRPRSVAIGLTASATALLLAIAFLWSLGTTKTGAPSPREKAPA